MFKYRSDVLKDLLDKGYTQTYIRESKILGQKTLSQLRHGKSVSLETLNTICLMLECQISDIIEIVPTQEEIQIIGLGKE